MTETASVTIQLHSNYLFVEVFTFHKLITSLAVQWSNLVPLNFIDFLTPLPPFLLFMGCRVNSF